MNASLARRARCCSSHAARQPLRRRCRHRLQLHAAAASTFAALGIDERVCEALASSGMHAPTEIQVKAAEPLLARRSTLVAAETGSGKTVAYLAPLLHNLLADDEAGGEGGSRGRRSA
jgi:superfamily II DNA/RNA helicase